MIFFDRDKLEKIVTNLLANAFKFTAQGGSVEVAVDIPHIPPGPPSKGGVEPVSPFEGGLRGMLEIRVQDSGIGIPADRLPHIFDRFYQADDFSNVETLHATSLQGIGIGLALTRELVELHRGEISVESAPGEGTTFTVRLPLGKAHLAAEEIEERGAKSVSSNQPSAISDQEMLNIEGEQAGIDQSPNHQIAKSPIVLIVEDNPDMRAYLRESLESSYKVLEAEDGEQGLQKGTDRMPDLIISDVMMPKMDGFELCRRLKSNECTSHIPVILLTARADAESKIEGLETGADDYLSKPFDARELRVRVKNLIALRRKLWEKFRQGSTVEIREIALTSLDAQFLERAVTVIEKHIAEPDYETEVFGKEIGLSRGHLNRKLQALTGQSTREFIRTLRLKRAAQLLKNHTGNVSEIAYQVGFNNLSHFARVFREMFDLSPSEYAARFSERKS
jgi:DNA-binding response OmpR family regulator